MSDEEAMLLLKLLHKYVKAYTPDIPQTISALAMDLAETMMPDSIESALDLAMEITETPGVGA
jgi:hypothetical protein